MAGTFLADGNFKLLMALLGHGCGSRAGSCCGRITNEREITQAHALPENSHGWRVQEKPEHLSDVSAKC